LELRVYTTKFITGLIEILVQILLNKFLIMTISLLIISSSSIANTAYGNLIHTFDDPTITLEDRFGTSVAIDGNRVLVGEPNDSTFGDDIGQAHLFDATSGALLRTFNEPTPLKDDFFGNSVAIDGNRALVGAPGGTLLISERPGQVYLFDATTGALLQTFADPILPGHEFSQWGWSVAIDGNIVVVGGLRDIHVDLFDATTGALLRTITTPSSGDAFGSSVAIEGNRVLVGAPGEGPPGNQIGRVYLFDATTGGLLLTFDVPPLHDDGNFGHSVAIDGNRVLVGAPFDNTHGIDVGQAHLFDATTGVLLHTFDEPNPSACCDNFGRSVVIDGNNVLVGANGGTTDGEVYLFDATTGALLRTFDNPPSNPNTNGEAFGWHVAIDGNKVLVGERFSFTLNREGGQAHLFMLAAGPGPVGGEFLPIETTALLVAGVQTPLAWMIYAFSAIGIGAFLFTRNPYNIRNVKVILRDYLDRF